MRSVFVPSLQARNIIGYRNILAANIERVVSRNSLQHHSRIGNSRSQRPNMIERPRKRNHAPRRNAPISRLDPDASAQCSRFADRSSRIRPNRRIAKSRRNRRSRTSGRSSSNVRRVPRIMNIAEKTDQRTPAISELMQIVLTQNHSPACRNRRTTSASSAGTRSLKKRAGRRCARPRGIDQVFQSNRNPVQRPAPFPAQDFLFRSPRLCQRGLGAHCNKGIQRGIKFLDAIQTSASQFDRRNFLPPQPRSKLNNSFQSRHHP